MEDRESTPFYQRFRHVLPPPKSSLDKYKFGAQFTLEEMWRHKIYSFGTLSIVHHEFNGNKCGAVGEYHHSRNGQLSHSLKDDSTQEQINVYFHRDKTRALPLDHLDYTGHNIAAIAVNEYGEILTSAFNHNVVYGSTAEHAEMRLLDLLFESPSLHFRRAEAAESDAAELNIEDKMAKLTVYTSLEPCQQCSGKLLLARVPLVVYCQKDPDIELQALEYYTKNFVTRPVPGNLFDFFPYDKLSESYFLFKRDTLKGKSPFWKPPRGSTLGEKKFKCSMPYFLCTDEARNIFTEADLRLDHLMTERDPDFMKLTTEQKQRVLDYRPTVDAMERCNIENRLWSKRMNLVNFKYHNSRELVIDHIERTWSDQELQELLAKVLPENSGVEATSIHRKVGSGESFGRAFINFATPASAHAAAAVLEERGFKISPAGNLLALLQGLLSEIASMEKELARLAAEDPKKEAENKRVRTNIEALRMMKEYVTYERKCERRGTMHR